MNIKSISFSYRKSGINDVYHQSLFYTLTIDKDCREHINDLYDFNRNSIKLSGLDKSWHTSGSINTALMGFNLFNGYVDEKMQSFNTL